MNKENDREICIITPSDIVAYTYCNVKWKYSEEMKKISTARLIKIIDVLSKKQRNEKEEADLEVFRKVLAARQRMERGTQAHTEHSLAVDAAQRYENMSHILLVFGIMLLLVTGILLFL